MSNVYPHPQPCNQPIPEDQVQLIVGVIHHWHPLSFSERRVLRGLILGKTVHQIAQEPDDGIHLAHNTIKQYTKTLYKKLGLNRRGELIPLVIKVCTAIHT